MNVSPSEFERSSAPFSAGGDLPGRMMGNFSPNRSPLEDLKKSGSPRSQGGGELKKFSGELQKASPSVNKPSTDKAIVDKPSVAAAPAEKVKSSNPSGDKTDATKRRARKKWKKPKDKPNRPLSAYNLFFQSERASMLGNEAKLHEPEKGKKRVHRKTHGKIGFADMARSIGQRWKDLPEDKRAPFLEEAAKEKKRYAIELKAWKEEQKKKPRSGKSLIAALKAESRTAENEGSSSVGVSNESSKKGIASGESLRLQMMAEEINQRNMALLQQRTEHEYLRALQERQLALLASRTQLESGMFQQYPSAAEASANAILQQFQMNVPVGGRGGSALMGMNPMAMNMGMGMNMASRNMMPSADFPQLSGMQSQLGTASRLQQLRGGLGAGMGDLGMGSSSGNNANNFGGAQGDLGRLDQFGSSDMAVAMARRFNNRFNM